MSIREEEKRRKKLKEAQLREILPEKGEEPYTQTLQMHTYQGNRMNKTNLTNAHDKQHSSKWN